MLAQSLYREGKQGHMARPLNRTGDHPLVLCTISGLTAGTDFPGFLEIAFKKLLLFVINMRGFICTKLAKSRASTILSARSTS